MKNRLRSWWDDLNTSFLVYPGILVLAAMALAAGTIHLDEQLRERWAASTGWVWGGSPEGARVMLSAIASSMITVAGVVFSVTIVVLALASNQFGPRTLRNFMRDAGNQTVLGVFLATFVYCLLVMRTVRGDSAGAFVPHVSVTVGIGLALASVGVLVFFVHHVSSSIQAGNLIAELTGELHCCLDRVFPAEAEGEELPDALPGWPPAAARDGFVVESNKGGYVQAVEDDALLAISTRHDLLLELQAAPGDFLFPGAPLVRARCSREAGEDVAGKIRKAFLLGRERTPVQDLEYCFLRLAEVAVRALSPGTNDPYTAVVCIDQLGAAMNRLAQRERRPLQRFDSENRLRVAGRNPDFGALAGAAWNEIRQYGAGSVSVLIALMNSIRQIVPQVRRSADLDVLRDHLWRIEHDARRHQENPRDLESIQEGYRKTLRAWENARIRLGEPEPLVRESGARI